MSELIYIVELQGWDPAVGTEKVLRYSTGRGFVTKPHEDPSNTYYDPRIVQPVSVARTMFAEGATMGRSQVIPGDLILVNADGALDFLMGWGLDGRTIRVYHAIKELPRYPQDFRSVFVGTVLFPEYARDHITVNVHDRQFDLDVPLQTKMYAGTNVLPDGLEGLPTDIAGKPKPLCYGIVKNIDPPLVNTARLIYQVNDGAVASVDKVYDRGRELTRGPDYIDQADMEANPPAAGEYRAWLAGGYFRLGATPDGLITADVTEGSSAADRTAGSIYIRLIERARLVNEWTTTGARFELATELGDFLVTNTAGGTEPGGETIVGYADVAFEDVTILNSQNAAQLGFWTKEEMTIADVCDKVADTVGAWWGVTGRGVFRIRRLDEPDIAKSVVRIVQTDLIQPLERTATNDPGSGIPVWRQRVRWGRFYATQETDVAASVPADRRNEIRTEWREVFADDNSVQQAHLLSPEVCRDSLFTTAADAQAEANRRLALYNKRRDRFVLPVQLNEEFQEVDLGDIVTLEHPRFGLSGGAPFVVIGVEPDAKAGQLTLDVWGTSPI